MGELSASLIKGFGIRAGRIVKEKSYFVCDTPDGLRRIGKTRENEDRILFQHEIKEHLIEAGYPWVDRYMETPEGMPFFRLGGDYYVMTAYRRHREPDFGDWADFSRVTDAAARWHTCARHVAFTKSPRIYTPTTPLTRVFARQANEINAIRKRVSKQARLSDFDVLFIKNAGHYARLIREASDALARTDYAVRLETAAAECHICHNALKEESVALAEDAVYITQYADAAVDVQLTDVCSLIRRHLKCAHANAAPIERIIEIYSQTEPLTHAAAEVLRALLLYPYPFMKIVSQYYSKKRTWTPNALTLRMQAVVSERDTYERYLY